MIFSELVEYAWFIGEGERDQFYTAYNQVYIY